MTSIGNGPGTGTVSVSVGEAFVQGILNGEFDVELDSISQAVSLRRRSIAMATAAGIRVGDRVRINERIKPKYLAGVEGVVTAKDEKWISVRIDSLAYTGRYSHNMRMPHSTVERAGDD